MKRIFEATDGTPFKTAAECKKHEDNLFLCLLIGLDEARIEAALNRTDADLADALERAGNIIGKKRRKDGHLKRSKKASDGIAAKPRKASDKKPVGSRAHP